MSHNERPAAGPARVPLSTRAHLRIAAILIAAADLIFWLYAFAYISRQANPLGDGLEWAAMVPIPAIALGLAFPALILSPFRRAAWIAAALAIAAAAANIVVWMQILGEFAQKTS
jgi:hypothetical protein